MQKIENLKTKLLFFALIPLLYLVMYLLDTTCIIKSLIGIPCPGCGMTRALLCAIHLKFRDAFAFHPLFFTTPVLFLYFLYDGRLFRNKKIDVCILISIFSCFLINWIWELLG